MELTFFILEMLGTIAFSISGAVTAIDSGMDLLGITIWESLRLSVVESCVMLH